MSKAVFSAPALLYFLFLLPDLKSPRPGANENAGVENAGLENAAPDCRGGKRGSSTVWKAEVSVI